jgi:hypothetical protein
VVDQWLLALLAVSAFVFSAIGRWAVFEKSGYVGWLAIVPIVSTIVLLRIAGQSSWWVLLAYIPVLNLLPAFLIGDGVAREFEQGTVFTLGLWLLGFLFFPILGVGPYRHIAQRGAWR